MLGVVLASQIAIVVDANVTVAVHKIRCLLLQFVSSAAINLRFKRKNSGQKQKKGRKTGSERMQARLLTGRKKEAAGRGAYPRIVVVAITPRIVVSWHVPSVV